MSIKLSLESLEVLDAIARKGSFAAAAESLFRVPSALTYTVRRLEEDLGVSLFNRSGHRAELTEAGVLVTNKDCARRYPLNGSRKFPPGNKNCGRKSLLNSKSKMLYPGVTARC